MADLADALIRDAQDPLVLQPTYLDIATAKKKAADDSSDFGLVLERANPGSPHVVKEVRFGSAAHGAGRIEAGDEIVQVNYQTVVGWQTKKVLKMCQENHPELILTLKKRPRHSAVTYGQIYIKPFRIPARQQRNIPANYFNNLPSPRAELLVAPSISFPKRSKGSSKKTPERQQAEASPDKSLKKKNSPDKEEPHPSPSPPKLPPKTPKSSSGNRPPPPPRGAAAAAAAAFVATSDEDDRRDASPAPSDSSSDESSASVDLDVDFDATDDEVEAFYNSGVDARSILGKSPTQSIRSALSRPRSAPLRRATISGTSSSSQYPAYINVSEVSIKNSAFS